MVEGLSGEPDRARDLNALAVRFLAGLLLLGGALSFALMLAIMGFDHVGHGGTWVYGVPGSRARMGLDPRVTTVLAAVGVGFVALGLVVFWIGHHLVERLSRRMMREQPALPRHGPRLRRRPMATLVAGALIFAAVLGARWYGFVTNTKSPSDAVGIWLNAHAPQPLRAWGCARLEANFAGRDLPRSVCDAR